MDTNISVSMQLVFTDLQTGDRLFTHILSDQCMSNANNNIDQFVLDLKKWLGSNEEEWRKRINEDYEIALLECPSTMPYKDYLKSKQWEVKRGQALLKANYRCQLCNNSASELNVHHRTYDRRGYELPEDLIVLCSSCHAKFHNKGGEK